MNLSYHFSNEKANTLSCPVFINICRGITLYSLNCWKKRKYDIIIFILITIKNIHTKKGNYNGTLNIKTAEFHTLLRNYRGIVGICESADFGFPLIPVFLIIDDDDDEIQFNLAGQEGIVTIPTVESYDKLGEDEELLEDAVAGYTARLKGDITLTVHCF